MSINLFMLTFKIIDYIFIWKEMDEFWINDHKWCTSTKYCSIYTLPDS